MDAHQKKMLHGREVDAVFADAVNVNALDLPNELARVAADLAYFGELHADAVHDKGNAELKTQQVVARLNIKHRERLLAESRTATVGTKEKPKGPTVDAVESAVFSDLEYLTAKEDELAAEVAAVRANSRMHAVRAKKDVLIQLAQNRRAEMGIDPGIAADMREKQYAHRAHGDRE